MNQGPSVKTARAIFAEHGERGWVELVREYGRSWRFQGSVVTADPELIRPLLFEPTHATRRSGIYEAMGKLPGPGGDGILFKEGQAWRERVKALMPAFNRANVDQYAGFIHREAMSWLDQLVSTGARHPDLYAAVMTLGVRLVLRVGYGLELADAQVLELGQALREYEQITMRPETRLDRFGTDLGALLRAPRLLLQGVGLRRRAREIQELLEQLLDRPEAQATEMGWLARLATHTRLGLGALTDEVNHLYWAYNAIDYVITVALHLLGQHPVWIERLRAEADEVLGDREHPVREDFERMPVMRAVMQEVLRRHPVSLSVARQTGEPLEYGGEVLEEGAEVLILLHALHHDPEAWDDPFDFDPERWLGAPERPREDVHYIPFLKGTRQCIGKQLARLEFVVVLHAALRHDLIIEHDAFELQPFMIPRLARPLPFRVQPQ